MSLPLSVRRHGGIIEQVAVVECDNGAKLFLSRFHCGDEICWRFDPDLKPTELMLQLYALTARQINQEVYLKALTRIGRQNSATTDAVRNSQHIILVTGRRGQFPSEERRLEVYFWPLFSKEEPMRRSFPIFARDMPFVTQVSTIPRSELIEAI